MATSIRDLLDNLDLELEADPGEPVAVGTDAARLLKIAGPMLERLADAGLDPLADGQRTTAARCLAVACTEAAGAFVPRHGRCSDLLGAASDLVELRASELTRSDRGYVTEAVGNATRIAVRRIESSGPYSQVGVLAAVRYRSAQLSRACAAHPPNAVRLGGIDRPVPLGSIPPDTRREQVLYESMCELTDQLRHSDGPLTVRQLRAVLLACKEVARAADARLGDLDSGVGWDAAEQISKQFVDGRRPDHNPSDRLMLCATRIQHVLAEMQSDTDVHPSAELLPIAAQAVAKRIRGAAGRWIITHGSDHFSEARVGEWLRRQSFIARSGDLQPLRELLGTATAAHARYSWPNAAAPARTCER
jgi:hypothetical protein